MIHIIFILMKPFSEPLFPVDVGRVILEVATNNKIELFHRMEKVISKKNFVLIWSDSSLYEWS